MNSKYVAKRFNKIRSPRIWSQPFNFHAHNSSANIGPPRRIICYSIDGQTEWTQDNRIDHRERILWLSSQWVWSSYISQTGHKIRVFLCQKNYRRPFRPSRRTNWLSKLWLSYFHNPFFFLLKDDSNFRTRRNINIKVPSKPQCLT